MLIRNTLLIFISLLIWSCTSTKMIQDGLTRRSSSLAYLHETPITKKRSSFTMSVDVTADYELNKKSQLTKVKSSVLPLLIFNQWKTDFNYTLGKSEIEEDITDFLKNSLVMANKRSGFLETDTSNLAKFSLTVNIDSVYARGPYLSHGVFVYFLIAYSYAQSEYAGPGEAYSRLSYQLKEGDKVLLENAVERKMSSQPLNHQVSNLEKLRDNYTTNLVESLSLTLKENIDSIIKSINRYISAHHDASLSELSPESVAELSKLDEPKADIIIYRRKKKERNPEIPILAKLNGKDIIRINSNEYKKIKLPSAATTICAGSSCVTFNPSLQEINYLECGFSKGDRQEQIEIVKQKVGKFYVDKINNLNAGR
ncbi:hypothetical protein C900_02665 [Fulvivirga imtechensis AK7]|uniref:Uncharacterized protein n=1 Tax=Fulvivirga imtechensis AK7 TaxID=1237149 RepID=L8JXS4_9BACT|nr:hypothetical protein [Fulvivirga imtechensis]ELR73580.1 hypothetical protein C900_02665 [Fulvivirga imtechensis AK7]